MSSFIEAFTERYTRPTDSVTVETAKGDIFTFSVVEDVESMLKAADKFIKEALSPGACHPSWTPYLTKDKKVKTAVYMLSTTCTGFKILKTIKVDEDGEELSREYEDKPVPTQLEWLQAAKLNRIVFGEIKTGWDMAQYGSERAFEIEVVKQAGEDSGETDGSIPKPSSPEKSTEPVTTTSIPEEEDGS